MNKLAVFFLMLSVGDMARGMDTRPEKPLVTRYPAWVDRLMYAISACKGVEDMTKEYQGVLESAPTNQYTKFFQDAQREVGIKESDILPIKICDVRSDMPEGIALTTAREMRVVAKNFDPLPYGVQRAAALHESLHHKYHDQTKPRWVCEKMGLAFAATSSLMTLGIWARIYASNQSRFRIVKAIGAPLASLFLSGIAAGAITKSVLSPNYEEFRADRDAAELLRCHECAHDLCSVTSPEYSGIYLNLSEVERYYNYYKEKNLLCNHHKHKKNDDRDDRIDS